MCLYCDMVIVWRLKTDQIIKSNSIFATFFLMSSCRKWGNLCVASSATSVLLLDKFQNMFMYYRSRFALANRYLRFSCCEQWMCATHDSATYQTKFLFQEHDSEMKFQQLRDSNNSSHRPLVKFTCFTTSPWQSNGIDNSDELDFSMFGCESCNPALELHG